MEEITSFQPISPSAPTSASKRKRRSFSLLTKKKLVEESQTKSLYSICNTYNVAIGSLILWRNQEDKIANSCGLVRQRNVKIKPKEQNGKFPEFEKELYNWVIESSILVIAF